MLAGLLHGRQDLRVEQIEIPALRPGSVRLQVRRAGICGSDIHYYSHGYCGAFVPTSPFVLGHEFVATVDAIAHDLKSPIVGERVVVNPAASCGQCERCKSGRANLCPHVVMLGSASTDPPTNGAFAEYVVVPAHQCHSIPETMDDGVATMIEPLAVALHAIHRAGSLPGARILVAGGGPIGLLTAMAARTFGASLVVVCEPSETRRAAALKVEADQVFRPTSQGVLEDLLAISDGGFDFVFEASGSAAAVEQGLTVLRRGGVFVQIGTVNQNSVALPVNDLMVREVSLLGTFRYANEFPEAIRLAAAGRINLEPLISAVYPLPEFPLAMRAACESESVLKVHITIDTSR